MMRPIQREALLSPVQQAWASLRDDPLVGTRQAANALGVSVFTLRRLLKRVRWCRVAGRIKIRQSEVLRLIQSCEVEEYAKSLRVLPERVSPAD